MSAAAKPPVAIAPLAVSDQNSEAAGFGEWRALKRWAAQHNITIHRIGRRPCILVTDILTVLQKDGAEEPAWSEDAVVARIAGGRR